MQHNEHGGVQHPPTGPVVYVDGEPVARDYPSSDALALVKGWLDRHVGVHGMAQVTLPSSEIAVEVYDEIRAPTVVGAPASERLLRQADSGLSMPPGSDEIFIKIGTAVVVFEVNEVEALYVVERDDSITIEMATRTVNLMTREHVLSADLWYPEAGAL